MKRKISPTIRDNITIRLIEEHDIYETLSWRNHDDCRVWFKTTDIISEKSHKEWFDKYLKKDDDYLFVIEFENKIVGHIAVYDIDCENRSAEIGRFLISPDYSGRGIMSIACDEIINLCYEIFNLSYLFLEVRKNNERAIKLYKRNRFKEESESFGFLKMSRTLK